jgi:anti-sigma factor ChrR (cupin superfamily)
MMPPLVITALLQRIQSGDIAWEPFRPGVTIARLYQHDDGHAAALLCYEPGATVPHHRHPGYEHILVLSGTQVDERGTHPTGTLVINTPGSSHAVSSPTGCVVLAIWEQPVQFY